MDVAFKDLVVLEGVSGRNPRNTGLTGMGRPGLVKLSDTGEDRFGFFSLVYPGNRSVKRNWSGSRRLARGSVASTGSGSGVQDGGQGVSANREARRRRCSEGSE